MPDGEPASCSDEKAINLNRAFRETASDEKASYLIALVSESNVVMSVNAKQSEVLNIIHGIAQQYPEEMLMVLKAIWEDAKEENEE